MTISKDEIKEKPLKAGELIEAVRALINKFNDDNEVSVSQFQVSCRDVSTLMGKNFMYDVKIEFTR